jgi:hypothetical protein
MGQWAIRTEGAHRFTWRHGTLGPRVASVVSKVLPPKLAPIDCQFDLNLLVLMLVASPAFGQQSKNPISETSVHITEVHNATDKAGYHTVEATAETKTVVYTIFCDGRLGDRAQSPRQCFPLAAGKDYSVGLSHYAILFKDSPDTKNAYLIKSQKEKQSKGKEPSTRAPEK